MEVMLIRRLFTTKVILEIKVGQLAVSYKPAQISVVEEMLLPVKVPVFSILHTLSILGISDNNLTIDVKITQQLFSGKRLFAFE